MGNFQIFLNLNRNHNPLDSFLIQRFFSPEEAVYVRADASGRRGICLWTRKEAYVKLRGGTIWREGRLDLHPVAGRLPACAAGCLFENQEPAPGYILGLCQQSDPIGRQIQ